MSKDIIIFDFDNTLVNSLKYWYFEMNKTTFKLYGLKPDKRFKYLRQGKCNKEVAEIFIKLTGLKLSNKEVFECWNNLMYNNYTTKIKCIAGAKEYLYNLKNQGKKLILATATNIELIRKVLPHFELNIFDEIYSENTLNVGKNSPEFFGKLLESIQAKPDNVFLFEDSFTSIVNATKNNIDCCAIIHKLNKTHKQELSKICKLVIKNYKDKRLISLGL